MEKDEPIEAPDKLEDPDLLYHQIKECLSYHDAKGLTTYILERNFSDQTIFFDVASDIVRCLTQANLEENPGFFQTCERCLKYLVRTGKPRLLLLAMLENWGDLVDDTQFKSVLGPIGDCLLAFPKPCQSSLESSIQAVYNYISRLELPDDNVLDGEERQLLDSDPVVIRLMDVSLAMLNFLEPFVKAVSIKDKNNKRRSMPHQATILSKYLLLLLNRPLIYMDLVPPDADKKMKAKSESRISAETVMSYLGKLNVDFFQLVEEIVTVNMKQEEKKRKKKEKEKKHDALDDEQNSKEENDNISNEKLEKEGKDNTESNKRVLDDEEEEEEEEDEDDELKVPDLSISCLLYLVFTEHLSVDNVPWVYSPQHILEFCLPYVIHLLNRTEFMILFKGVHLLNDCLQRLEASTLSASYLENDIYIQLLSKLTRVMLHCPVADLRQLSVKVFTDMIKKFQSAGRCRAYECLLVTCDNPGVLGYCIQLLKEEINVCLQCDPVTDQTFLGKRLHKLLRIILHLPEAETTDILQHSDRIISAMNFVRYLALRDPPDRNVTGFWTLIPEVEEKFLSQMQIAVDMSRAHYKLELNNIKSRQKSKKKQADDDDDEPEVTVSIGSQLAPGMPPEEQAKVLNNALNTFDIMESLLCRVREILQQQQPSCS